MPARFYTTQIAGITRFGVEFEFDTESEREEFLAGRGLASSPEPVRSAKPDPVGEDGRGPGRPSCNEPIARAIQELGERFSASTSRAKLVWRHLADRLGTETPSHSKVEKYLAEHHPARLAGKSRRNSRRGIRRSGGSTAC